MRFLFAAALGLGLMASSNSAQAIGCVSGGAMGAVAGHYAGHHAVLGAVAGCVAGHHAAKVAKTRRLEQQNHPSDGANTAMPASTAR